MTKKPADWENILTKSQNKSQMMDVMNEVWCSDAFALKLELKKVVSVVQGHFHLLQSDDRITVKNRDT